MTPISAVVITFNEEKKIESCINSLKKVADEIIIIDSFSTDSTKELCEHLGAKVIQHVFKGYIEQKNFALSQTTYKYNLSLDADEILSDELITSILKVKANINTDGYSMNRLNNFCGKWIYHCGWYPDKKIRLFDKTKGKWGGVNPHDKFEFIQPSNVMHLKGDILHYTYDSINEYVEQQKHFAKISAQHMQKLSKKSGIFHVYLKPPIKFIRDYFFHFGILDGYYGFMISKIAAQAMYWKYARLRTLNAIT